MKTDILLTIILSGVLGLAFAALGILNSRKGKIDLETFIAFRNSTGTGVAVASIVASIAGAWILFSPAETGSWAGISGVIGYGVGQGMPILVLVVFGARLRKIMPTGYSFSEFLDRRYGPVMGRFTAVLMIFYMFTFLTAELTGIAQAFFLTTKLPLLATAAGIIALTLVYTAYGGLRSSIFTDFLQFVFLVPLLLIIFVATLVHLGGAGALVEGVGGAPSELWNPVFRPGVEFAISLVIAITAANIFHQGFWQRVYACRDSRVMRRSFFLAGLITIPIIVIMGLFGILASERGLVAEGQASTALFSLLLQLPSWIILLALLFGLVLVMSSADTLINGIISILVTQRNAGAAGARRVGGERRQREQEVKEEAGGGTLLRARVLTVLISVLAVIIGSQGYSVLYLFLVADLVCSAVMFPALFGLYASRITGVGALVSSAAGMVAGALFFPTPMFTSWNGFLPANLLYSFAAALLVSALLAILFNWTVRKGESFSFDSMSWTGMRGRP